MAKDFFKENNVSFEDFNVAEDLTKRKEMIDKSGQMGVPVIKIGTEVMIGFDQTQMEKLLGV